MKTRIFNGFVAGVVTTMLVELVLLEAPAWVVALLTAAVALNLAAALWPTRP